MKVLFIRFSSIGDIVLTTPAIRCLKLQQPEAEIHFLVKKQFAPVIRNNPYIDKLILLDSSWDLMIHQLMVEDYDYVIDLHKNFRSYRITNTIRTKKMKVFRYQKLSVQKFLLTRFGINTMPTTHISIRSLNTLKPLGIINDDKGLDYFISPSDQIKEKDLPASHSFGYVAIVIGASYYTKKLPVKKLQELCLSIPYPIVLIGGKEDLAEGNEIATVDDIKVYNACGKFTLNESADIVRKSKVVISHDTGLLYIACAFNKKVIAIWGGTSPQLAVEPYFGNHGKYENFIVPNLSCQPCSNYGTKKCPKGHFKCMNNQPIDQISLSAMNMIK